MVDEFARVESSSSIMDGNFKVNASILWKSSGTVMTSLGLESLTCAEISVTLYKGLQVVAMAPMETTARKQTGKRMELGASSKTTSPRLIPRRSRERERAETCVLSWRKVRESPERASARARVSAAEEVFWKRKEVRERLGLVGRLMGGLGEEYVIVLGLKDFAIVS